MIESLTHALVFHLSGFLGKEPNDEAVIWAALSQKKYPGGKYPVDKI